MGAPEIASILVALVAAFGAWAAQRSASRAGSVQANVEGRLEAERGAYERARRFDIDTIERQQKELIELREAELKLRNMNDELRIEMHKITARLIHLEEDIIPDLEQQLYNYGKERR